MLVVKNLTYRFEGAHTPLFNNVSFTVNKPGITCVTGKNGVGKSTLFRLLQEQIPDVIMMQQKVDRMLAPSFTVQENLQAAGLGAYPGLSDFAALVYNTHGYDQIPLERQVNLLSGGQKQIVSLLMCLQQSTAVLLLDEPTAALDEKNAHYFMDFVHNLAVKNNIVALCISHDPALVEQFKSNGVLHLEQRDGTTVCIIK